MSAFVVEPDHIDAILDFAMRAPLSRRAYSDVSELNKSGATLWAANVKSVCARYQDDGSQNYMAPADYRFRFSPRRLSAVEAIKAIKCLEYQSCEASDWPTSEACRILEHLQNVAIASLPGYSDAAWSIDEAA